MFKDKKVLITGASKGLGKEAAIAFEKEGAELILVARSLDKLTAIIELFSFPDKHHAYSIDLLDSSQIDSVMDDVSNKNVDIIIHCAGGSLGYRDNLLDASEFKQVFMLNIIAAAQINRALTRKMIDRKKGNIIHVGSLVSSEARASVAYNSSKAALTAYVRSLGKELIEQGIIVSGILPGAFYGDENAMNRFEINNPKGYIEFINSLPEKRMPNANEFVPMLMLLANEESKIMSGSLINMDGGQGMAYFNC
jgi:short-subunit dehydrogenase